MTDYVAPLLISVLFCFLLTPLARILGWVDSSNYRKQHSGDIPLVGGPAIVLAVTAVMLLHGNWSPSISVLGWSSLIVFFTGLIDDRRHIPVPIRFVLQAFSLMCMVLYGDVMLNNFGSLFWDKNLDLGPLSIPITVFSALGVINAFNMIDGLDGLSGSIAVVAFCGLAFLAWRSDFVEAYVVLLIVMSSVLGFLLLNFRFPWRERALVFLGDSGSSWLGFVLAWFFIMLSQDDPVNGVTRAFAPITAIWLFGVPLMDTTHVMIHRLRVRQPVFGADRRHLHHLLLRSGFTVRQTWTAIVGSALLMAFIGILGEMSDWSEWGRFYTYLALACLYLVWMHYSWKKRRFLGREVV